MSVGGNFAYVEYGIQSNFTTALAAGASTRAFGMDQRITSFSINENKLTLGDLYSEVATKFAYGRFEGQIGVEAMLSDPWGIDMVLGAAATTGVGPYTHTYDTTKTVRSATVEVGVDTTTDRVIQCQRATVKDLNYSMALDEVCKISYNLQFGATAATAGTSLDASVSTDSLTTPFTLVHATVESPSATILAEIQSADITLNPNIKMIYGIDTTAANAGFAVNAIKGRIDISGKFTLSVVNNSWWNKVRARAEPTDNTLRFKFTNGGAGTAERSFQLTCAGLGLGELNMSNISVDELITEEIPFSARDVTAVAVNNTSTPP